MLEYVFGLQRRKESRPQLESTIKKSVQKDEEKPNLKILLVEDNEMNRKVVRMLLTQEGHRVEVASNGLEAVEAVNSEHFDLVFMDVQMPEMDGIEASQKIRALEAGKRHTPIVAMTAFALQGDAKRCLDAGMDDYVAKPVDVKRVLQVIESCANGFYGDGSKASIEPYTTSNVAEPLMLDVGGALPRFGYDIERYHSLLSEFLNSLPETMSQMKDDYAEKDWRGLANKAHNLKGLSANFGAMQISSKALELDELCRNGEIESVEDKLNEIDQMMDHLPDQAYDIIEQVHVGSKFKRIKQ
jgi:CheY-like chemotaxis protein/HPt (histidine-containing phosphotransfer) domain-containing protein